MRGEVLYYEPAADAGLITGEDGARYRFRRADMLEFKIPSAGARVDFVARGADVAGDVAVLEEAPPEKLDIWGYFAKCMRKSFNGIGRARRMEYWSFVLFSMLFIIGTSTATIGLGVVGQFYAGDAFTESFSYGAPIVLLGVALIFVPAHICVTIRRFHDIGSTGWWVLLNFVPVGWLIILVCALISSQRGPNKYGPYPKAAKAS